MHRLKRIHWPVVIPRFEIHPGDAWGLGIKVAEVVQALYEKQILNLEEAALINSAYM